jgi:hypothetical protein
MSASAGRIFWFALKKVPQGFNNPDDKVIRAIIYARQGLAVCSQSKALK